MYNRVMCYSLTYVSPKRFSEKATMNVVTAIIIYFKKVRIYDESEKAF